MQKLFDQEDRHFAIRFTGGPKAPLFVKTPTVAQATTKRQVIEDYRHRLLGSLSFALPMTEAVRRLETREHRLLTDVVGLFESDEPTTAKRRIT
jgi:hypothetical protein